MIPGLTGVSFQSLPLEFSLGVYLFTYFKTFYLFCVCAGICSCGSQGITWGSWFSGHYVGPEASL